MALSATKHPSTVPPSDKSREVRLGLVMYGGISLAIYINGVAREFYRAVRGESVYKLIKAFTDSDIVVDIVSGTSAGGVNGILLGHALSNKADFAKTALLWREAGDIGTLILDPAKAGDKPLSILDGEGHYQRQLEDAFQAMVAAGEQLRDEHGDWKADGSDPSHMQEMDVFITSTDVDGRTYTWLDAREHTVDIKDHHAMFQLKFRDGRKNDFAPDEDGAAGVQPADRYRALAKLARMTSCFPVAFPPVRVAAGIDPNARENREYCRKWSRADALISRWGNLGKLDAYFLDGGVLDNKPFTYTITEIFHRLADRQVKRLMFWVEPDPEQFDPPPQATQPNVLQAAQRALISIPGYESISEDLKLLTRHNEKIERYRRLIGLQSADTVAGLKAAAERARRSLELDCNTFIDRMRALETGQQPQAPTGTACRYATARIVTLSERGVRGILKEDGHDRVLDQPRKKAAVALHNYIDKWREEHLADLDWALHRLDVYFRLRRLFHVLYACSKPGLEDNDADQLRRQILYHIGRQIRLLEIVQGAVEKLVDDGEFDWERQPPEAVWYATLWGYAQLMQVSSSGDPLPPGYDNDWAACGMREGWLSQDTLQAVHANLFGSRGTPSQAKPGRIGQVLDELRVHAPLPQVKDFDSLLGHTDACERRMLCYFDAQADQLGEAGAGLPRLKATYDDFMALDADLFTLETFADLREKDIIKTVRISPRDAQRGFCALDLKRKMAGDEAFHFGGFFKKSWRANDILWGRADAACQLTEMLLERERVREVVRSPRHRPELQARVAKGGDLHPAQLFPKAPPALQQALEEWLLALVGDTEPRPCDDDGSRWERGVSQLIECAQYEFLGEEICNVLKDAVSEQLDWNYSRQEIGKLTDIGRQGVANAGKFGLASGRWGSTVHAYVSEAAGEQAKAHLSDPGRLKAFFTERYSVGSESMGKDVPSWILLEILFRGLLVAKDAFTFALPVSWRGKVTASLPYRLLTAGLWMLYGLALTLRSGDRTAIAVRFSVFAVSAFTWLLLIVGGSQLVCTAGGPSLLKAALLVSPTIALMMMFPKSRWWGLSLGIVVLVLAKFGIRC